MSERQTVRRASNGRILEPSDPSDLIVAVVKSDTVNFTNGQCRAVNADADGVVDIVMMDDTVVTGYQMHKGYNPIAIKRVNTGGDAINMWALF